MNKFIYIAYTIFFILIALVLLKFFLILVLIALVLLWMRTLQMKKEPHQQEFLQGKLPNPKPEGFYKGQVGFDTSWLGKEFSAEHSIGINIFRDKKGAEVKKYPFKTHVEKGLFDEHLLDFKIDYNVPGNPFWIRWILDEIVEVHPNEYLGKVHLRIIPGFPFSVLYFELKK